MKKLILAALVCAATAASAHDVWVIAPQKLADNQILKAELGYGHFPYPEAIAKERVAIFAPMQVIDAQGETQNLVQKGENYQFQSEKPLKAGSYWVTATYQPTFWSQNAQGWKMANLQTLENATYCEQTQMFGKAAVAVGKKPLSAEMAMSRIGLPLEIVPLKDPAKIKVGEPFPVQVFFQDKPLAGETVIATADSFVLKDMESAHNHREPQAFSGKTDSQGRVNFIPLTNGAWKLKVIHKTPFPDAAVCQQLATYSTLILPVGKQIKLPAQAEHHHHH